MEKAAGVQEEALQIIQPNADIEMVLECLEKESGVRIIFACESGSRAHGTATAASDHDLKGFYTALSHGKKDKKKPLTYESSKLRSTSRYFGKYSVPIDYEFIELGLFLTSIAEGKSKREFEVSNNDSGADRVSTNVYRNVYPNIRLTIVYSCSPPHEEVVERLEKDLSKLETKEGREARKAINMVIDCLLLMWMRRTDTYPRYNWQDLLAALEVLDQDHPDSLAEYLQVRELITQLGYRKQP